jgi:c-di-GMP-binding flagellar brake protein YcgR
LKHQGADACRDRLVSALKRGGVKVKSSGTIEPSSIASGTLAREPPDRRKSKRFQCAGTGDVIVLGGALHFAGELHDLSSTGCLLMTKTPFTLERGTQVEVVMVVNRIQFRVAAGVRGTNKMRGVGLEFVNVSPRGARLIQDLIAELKAKTEREK